MARAYVRDVLTYGDDGTLIALANAVGLLYTDAAATIAVSDAYSVASGGSPITQVTTDATGTWEVFFETAKTFYVKWTDNGDTAYPIGVPTTLKSWTAFVRRHEAIDTLDDVSVSNLTLSGTFADRPAAGTAGRRYRATWASGAIQREYVDTGSAWASASDAPGIFNPLDFGADPTGATDSRAAFVACLTAASTALASGLPYGDGSIYGEIQITAGQYTISSSINLPTPNKPLKITGVGGISSVYSMKPVIVFTTGGFVLGTAQSDVLEWNGLYIIGAPALFVDGGSGHGSMSNCSLRSTTTGQPALQLRNTFWGTSIQCDFRSPDASTPSVLIESATGHASGVFEGWLFRWLLCRFEENGIRWDINADHSGILGQGTWLQNCETENFDANTALLHIRNVHATANTHLQDVVMMQCGHYDAGDPTDYIKLETLGTGSLTLNGARLVSCPVGGGGQHVRSVETGGGIARADWVLIDGIPAITFSATPGGFGAMNLSSGSSWDYRGDRAAATGYRGRIDGDAWDRFMVLADGTIFRGLGAATPYQKCGFFAGTGSPEGVVTATRGSIFQRTDGGAGTSTYIKESDTTNTGWVPLTTLTADTTLAEGVDLTFGASTGTKIGTGATQKLGFWNVTPVVQPSANADTSGATLGQLETEVNELKALLRSLGLMAT